MKSKKTIIIAAVAVIIIALAAFAFAGNGENGAETAAVRRGDLVKNVSVSGKVAAVESAELGFAKSGTVARVYKRAGESVRQGEVIAELSAGSIRADLLKAQADLAAAEAEAAKVGGIGGSTSASAERDAIQAIAEAFSAADDAVRSKVDQFIENPRSPNPRIIFAFDDYALRERIDAERVQIEAVLENFTSTDLSVARRDLGRIASFLSDVARAVNDFEPNNTLTQTTIDKYKTDVASARSEVNSATASLVSSENALSGVSSDQSIETARVASARATVARHQADLADSIIRAPFNGVITRMDATVGEAASANEALISLKSGDYLIEAYVPEVSIAGLAVGNPAAVTLDAYGSGVEFPATVSHVDPAETIRDGVSNYKIELVFVTPDERVRSGMTANVTVETMRKPDTLLVPLRSIKDGRVKVKAGEDGEEIIEREVSTGISDSEGNVEVLSGLSEGDLVLVDPVTNE